MNAQPADREMRLQVVRRTPAVAAAIAGLAVVLVACRSADRHVAQASDASSSGAARSAADVAVSVALVGGVRVRVPRGWQQIRYHGYPAPVMFPIVFLTDHTLRGPCVTGPARQACTGPMWFAPHWRTPKDGVLLDWRWVSIPSPATDRRFLPSIHTRTIKLADRPAKIVRGPAASCPVGAAVEIDAYVQRSPSGYPGNRLDMTACLGSHVPDTVRGAVLRMLHSLHFSRGR